METRAAIDRFLASPALSEATRRSYRFDLDHTPRYKDRNQSLTVLLNHTLSPRSFYSVGGSFFSTERKRGDGVYFDDIAQYGVNGQADLHQADIPWFWQIGRAHV